MNLHGKAYKFGDDISTDLIISGKYKFSITDETELAKHVMEDADPDFAKKVVAGKSFIVAGRNFGMGSSREQAPLVIKTSGVNAVLAASFARIFYRNSINIGLLLIECETKEIKEGDELSIILDKGLVLNTTRHKEIKITPLPPFMEKILQDGGLIEHFKKYGGFRIDE
ncbi:MAG: 3-isopropylmalate dehydratase small subunit [Candidatus Omnitrophota bacterium]